MNAYLALTITACIYLGAMWLLIRWIGQRHKKELAEKSVRECKRRELKKVFGGLETGVGIDVVSEGAEPAIVLAKAALRAGQALGLTQEQTANVIGLDQSCFNPGIDPQKATGQRALMLIRIFQNLDALVGSDPVLIKCWMKGRNQGTNGIPAEQMQTSEGLEKVLGYLGAMREH